MIKDAIAKVVGGKDLTEAEMLKAMDEILTGLSIQIIEYPASSIYCPSPPGKPR